MRKRFCLALLAVFLAYLPERVLAQDEYPVIVSAPQVSVSVFTNWQLIKLTYTIGYLDGYQPNFEEARPENMSFGLEIDQEKGSQLLRLNKRRYKNENYEDLVYYVRHIGEKKGEITIPEQIFRYIKEEPGQSAEGQLVHEAKAPATVLRYDSVLTKEANDIMDVIDFGSFQKQEKIWRVAYLGLVVLSGLVIFFIFYRPAVARKMTVRPKNTSGKVLESNPEKLSALLLPKQALQKFIQDFQSRQTLVVSLPAISTEIRPTLDQEERARLANGLKELLGIYIPTILDSDTPEEISLKIKDVPDDHRYKNPLVALGKQLVYLDGLFYGQKAVQNLSADLRDALLACRDLARADAWWPKVKVWVKNIGQRRRR